MDKRKVKKALIEFGKTHEGSDFFKEFLKTKEGRALQSYIINDLYRSSVKFGYLNPKGKTDQQIEEEFFQLLALQARQGNYPYTFSVDYKDDLLNQARINRRRMHYTIACLLYATWVEHWVNDIISIYGSRNGLEDEDIIQIIRDTKFQAKVTWLWTLLDLKPISVKHRRSLEELITWRNGFVHYKWKQKSGEDLIADIKQLAEILERFENTITYLNRYYHKHILKGVKKKVI